MDSYEAADIAEWLNRPRRPDPTPTADVSSAEWAAVAVFLGLLTTAQCVEINEAIADARAEALDAPQPERR